MSCNVFIESSVLNCSYGTAAKLKDYLEKHVGNPKVSFDESGDLIISEDFDRRHILALLHFVNKEIPEWKVNDYAMLVDGKLEMEGMINQDGLVNFMVTCKGHLCVSDFCRFSLATIVGDYLVSTIGEYYPRHDGEMDTIGFDRFYETMVFKVGEDYDEGCHCRAVISDELDFEGYNTAKDAYNGHLRLCQKWDNQQQKKGGF